MEEGKKEQGGNTSQNHRDENPKNEERHAKDNNKKRGWSHIIDEVDYSSGPGDNIYVFG